MQLSSSPNQFQLELVGYQYPHATNEQYDSNWLIVEGTVKHAGGRWAFRDPCLLTWEVSELAAWLEALSSDQATDTELGFIEPNISFSSLSDGKLRVSFSLEALPPPGQFVGENEDEFSLLFAVDAQSLRTAAQELRAQLAKFPERAVQ